MKYNRIMNALLTFIFLICLAVPLLTFNTVAGKVSTSENRTLATFPPIFNEDGSIRSDAINGISNFLKDNIGSREKLISLYGAVQYGIFRQSPSPNVQIGKDGWLYYTLGDNLEIAKGTFPLTDDMLYKIKENLCQLSDYCESIGTELVLVLPASKVSIYPEYVRGDNYTVRETPCDTLSEYLAKETDLKVVPLKDALLKQKDNQQLYFKTDTHWNFQGAYIGYQEIVRKLNNWGLMDEQPVEVSFYESSYQGDLATMMGNDFFFGPEKIWQSSIVNPTSVRVTDEAKMAPLHDLQLQYNAYATRYLYENSAKNTAPNILVYGDSMFASWEMTQLLAEHASSLNFFWWVQMGTSVFDFTPALLQENKPDIFILEVGERDIGLLAQER